MKCPVCRAPFRGDPVCSRCQTNLLPLLEIRHHAFCYYNQALEQAKKQQWEQAAASMDAAVDQFQSQTEFHLLRGKILAHLHRYHEAIHAWQTALHLNPSSTEAQKCLSTLTDLIQQMKLSTQRKN
ncbi:MAG: tetratricopeptide repeat protein [SAR324 cluster bacterium]|nr:tetratricopeptide repeat protein [SAR324 cluster bacterium]